MVIVPTVAPLSLSTLFLTAFPFDSDGTCLGPSAQIPSEGATNNQTGAIILCCFWFFHRLI